MYPEILTILSLHKYFTFNEYIIYDYPEKPLTSTLHHKPYTTSYLSSNLTRAPKSNSSILLAIPKFQKCSILLFHLYARESFLLKHLSSNFNHPCHILYQRYCNTLCDPNLNWHIFLRSLPYPVSTISNSDTSKDKLTIPKNTFIRNALKYDIMNTNKTLSVLIRFKWISFLLDRNIPEESGPDYFDKILLISQKRRQDFEGEACPIIKFPSPEKYRSRQPWHIIRSEPDPHPATLLHLRIIGRVNGTPIDMMPGENYLEVVFHTPNSITGPIGITAERWLFLDYSTPVAVNKLIFVTGLPKPIGYSFAFLLNPLSFWIWVNVWSSLGLSIIFLKLLFVTKLQTIEIAFAMLRPLIDQSMPEKFCLQQSKHHYLFVTRFIIISWLFSCLLMSNLYRSFITGYLIQPTMTVPPKTFHDLALSNYILGFQNESQNNVKQAIFSSIDEYSKSNQSSRHLSVNIIQCFSEILDSLTACITFDISIDLLGREFLTDSSGQELFLFSKDYIYPTISSVAFNPSSDLKEAASTIVGRHLSSGLDSKYVDILRQFGTAIGMQKRKQECMNKSYIYSKPTSMAEYNPYCNIRPSLALSTAIVMYPVFVLLIGLSVCSIVFLYEAAKYSFIQKYLPSLKRRIKQPR